MAINYHLHQNQLIIKVKFSMMTLDKIFNQCVVIYEILILCVFTSVREVTHVHIYYDTCHLHVHTHTDLEVTFKKLIHYKMYLLCFM